MAKRKPTLPGSNENNLTTNENSPEASSTNVDIHPLAVTEAAYKIVNHIYSNQELLEKLISAVENWILTNLTKSDIEKRLVDPDGLKIDDILLESLSGIVTDLSKITKVNE